MTGSSGGCEPCKETLHAVHVAVLRALDLSGKRMISSRSELGRMLPHPAWTRHTHRKVYRSQLDELLRPGDWDLLKTAYPERPELAALADTYVRELLVAGIEHDISYLETAFEQAGIDP